MLDREIENHRTQVVEVSGAGTSTVNGRYIRDTSLEFVHLGRAYRKSRDANSKLFAHVLLHEEAWAEREGTEGVGGGIVGEDRWLVFHDDTH
jgi:hypothetical protein